MPPKPAVSLAAVAGRRQATLELAQRIEHEGFSGIYCPSFGDGMGLCEALALVTHEIPFGTSIVNIYTRHPADYAQTAALIHEWSQGRFRFGIGISHGPTYDRLGLTVGKPLRDIRTFVNDLRVGVGQAGELPPITLATLRHLPPEKRHDAAFFIGNMVPTCISDLTFRTPRMAIRVFSQGHFSPAQHPPTVVCCRHMRGDTPTAVAPGAWYGSRAPAYRSVPRPTSAHREGVCRQDGRGRGDQSVGAH